MEVYHASNCIIEKPDTLHSRQFLDFGPGFYITTMYDQAEKYAARFVRRGKQAFYQYLCFAGRPLSVERNHVREV